MNCYFHEDREAVATCVRCGKSLCKECASKYKPCFCDECAKEASMQQEKERTAAKKEALIDTTAEFIKACIAGLIWMAAAYALFSMTGDSKDITFGMVGIFFFAPYGWALITYLEQYLPTVIFGGFLFIIYIVFKIIASIIVGVPCFIFQVVRFIVRTIRIRKA